VEDILKPDAVEWVKYKEMKYFSNPASHTFQQHLIFQQNLHNTFGKVFVAQ